MVTPINFNKARKTRARTAKMAKSAENRAKFGRAKTDEKIDKARAIKDKIRLDDHKLDT